LLATQSAGHVDILKLDIEGAEREVFSEGSAEWIEKVGLIIVELHDHLRPGCRAALDAAVRSSSFSRRHQGEHLVLVKQGAAESGMPGQT
ncbi:MAG TPA: FkbM family methyltransferase, partial [Gemmatimonadales bacterium]|nr:FkbM family methyltransferase [Gemmatimonadales bacterium]